MSVEWRTSEHRTNWDGFQKGLFRQDGTVSIPTPGSSMKKKRRLSRHAKKRVEELFSAINVTTAGWQHTGQSKPLDDLVSSIAESNWDNLRAGDPIISDPSSESHAALIAGRPMQQELGDTARVMDPTSVTPSTLLDMLDDDPNRCWSEDELILVEQVADQLSQALTNAQLFEQTRSARDALQVSVRYQKSVADAVSILSERGSSGLVDVLKLLGEASLSSRVYYLETQIDYRGPYFRMISEWSQPELASQALNQILNGQTDLWLKPWLKRLEEQGFLVEIASAASADGRPFLESLGVRSLLALQVARGHDLPGCIIFEQIDVEPKWTKEEIATLQTAASALSNTLIRENLFNQLQVNLSETETQYQASAELSSAVDITEILTILRQFTILGHINTSRVFISLFDQPWTVLQKPNLLIPVASWSAEWVPAASIERFLIGEWQNLEALFSPEKPMLIFDLVSEARIDPDARSLFGDTLGAKSLLSLPLNVSNRWVGQIIALFSQTTGFTEREIRRLVSLSGQAAVAIESLRLLEESRRRANQLQTAAEITRDTSGTLALDSLLKKAISLISERFGFYHASIFLIDDTGSKAVVRESTGLAGEELKRIGHNLEVGGRSLIGQVTGTGEPLVLNDVRSEEAIKIHKPNPLLPLTRAELGIPLKIGERVLGALDVQSDRLNAFSDDDISVLQILSDQIAVAVDNARSYEIAQTAVDEIREADRLKTQFLANMSHELRTPLNSIIGFSRVILKGIDGPINDQQKQDLTAIYNSGQHLLGLINDVLDLSRIEAGKMDLVFENNVSLADIIHSVISTIVGLVKDKPIRLEQRIDPKLPLITADSMKIRQVLLNLLSNAAKFTEQGSITVEAAPHIGTEGNLQVVIRVIDTGLGIAPQDQEKLFLPFSQVDGSLTRKTGGSGLGLSISSHLIRLHRGQIGLRSEIGKGSEFYVILPVDQPETNAFSSELKPELPVDPDQTNVKTDAQAIIQALPTTIGEISAPIHSDLVIAGEIHPPSEPRLVLIIEKDHRLIELYKRYLSASSCTVIALTKLEQALTVARGVQPSVITLDIAMAACDQPTGPIPLGFSTDENNGPLTGLKILKELKDDPSTRHIPVIVCSMAALQEKAFSLGAADYLLKPILEDELIQAICRHHKTDP